MPASPSHCVYGGTRALRVCVSVARCTLRVRGVQSAILYGRMAVTRVLSVDQGTQAHTHSTGVCSYPQN